MASLSLAQPQVAQSLALALVAASNAPALLLDGDLTVVAASASFCRAFGYRSAEIRGRRLFDLRAGEWDTPRLRSLLGDAVAGRPRAGPGEMDFDPRGLPRRRLGLDVQKLEYDGVAVRLLVSISDLTDLRAAETLNRARLQDKDSQLQELQHRIANSLQIIASVLMLNARKEHSDDTRREIFDAHRRVMSVATLQRQLAASGLAEVNLRGYLTDLCQSIAASMIDDRDRLSLTVTVDESMVTADVSMTLGLIVTELVINALKHAFPDGRRGAISVDFRSTASGWMLSVRDDGVGYDAEPSSGRSVGARQGANIVEALTRQLHARIEITRPGAGMLVSIVQGEAVA